MNGKLKKLIGERLRMNSKILATTPKQWLTMFLMSRAMFKGPNERPLYTYHVMPDEYALLRIILKNKSINPFDSIGRNYWAACYCLYVAETFRRSYDAKDGGWSWGRFEREIEHEFSQQQHAELVKRGLEGYWKRPIRQRGSGRNLLGSLFSEGGLPWPLVKSETHGFGIAVRRGLVSYYRTLTLGLTTASTIAECEHYLPETFRTLETRQLLSGIVDQLMLLADSYPMLKDQPDPANYLDVIKPDWRTDFPIPLDEENAKALINDWLKDAGLRRQERQIAIAKSLEFSSTHRLIIDDYKWKLCTEITLPKIVDIIIDTSKISSTRFEMGFYEGDTLLARGGGLYGQMIENGVQIRFPKNTVQLNRRKIDEQLSIRLLDNGVIVHSIHVENGSIELEDRPLIFASDADEWIYISSETCTVSHFPVRVRLPNQFILKSGDVTELNLVDIEAKWFEIYSEAFLESDEDIIKIGFDSNIQYSNSLKLSGILSEYETNPSLVYKGFPHLLQSDQINNELNEFINGTAKDKVRNDQKIGQIKYQVKDLNGSTVFYRKFGVLPQGFQILSSPATNQIPAKLVIKNFGTSIIKLQGNNLDCKRKDSGEELIFELNPTDKYSPENMLLEVSGRTGTAPIQIKVPFPISGAYLVDAVGKKTMQKDFTINELAEHKLILSTNKLNNRFLIDMEVKGPTNVKLRRTYSIVISITTSSSLFSYVDDIVKLLSVIPNQDAYVHFSIGTQVELLNFQVRRYRGNVVWDTNSNFFIAENEDYPPMQNVNVAAMLLGNPKIQPILLHQSCSQGIQTGSFEMPNDLYKDSPWLIYPMMNSEVQFRPRIFAPDTMSHLRVDNCILPLNNAAKKYHPLSNPDSFNDVISDMEFNFSHSGWQYFADLKQNYHHLPLSTFEAWIALANHPHVLATAIFKLEIEEYFCIRIRDELAVMWETITMQTWAKVFSLYTEWLNAEGLPKALISSLIENRRNVLPATISGFEFVERYLQTGMQTTLLKAPIEIVLPNWYQSLRRQNMLVESWPMEFNMELHRWMQNQPHLKSIANLSFIEETHSVTYLPIFMAHVTTGIANITDLPGAMPRVKFMLRVISDFDKVSWYQPVHALMVSYLLASNNVNKAN